MRTLLAACALLLLPLAARAAERVPVVVLKSDSLGPYASAVAGFSAECKADVTEHDLGEDPSRTEQVIQRQVYAILERVPLPEWDRIRLAYEPVWAIGTGRTASPDDAAQVHELIRFELGSRGVTGRVPILYGGSVNAGNVLALLAREELDGVLVGGASLDPDGWAELVGHGG